MMGEEAQTLKKRSKTQILTETPTEARRLIQLAVETMPALGKLPLIEGDYTKLCELCIQALKRPVADWFLSDLEAHRFYYKHFYRILIKPNIKFHIQQKLLAEDPTYLASAISPIEGAEETLEGYLREIRKCEKTKHARNIREVNEICAKCGNRIKDIIRVAMGKSPLCKVSTLPYLVDDNIIDLDGINMFSSLGVEKKPLNWLEEEHKQNIYIIHSFCDALYAPYYTVSNLVRERREFRKKTSLGQELQDFQKKMIKGVADSLRTWRWLNGRQIEGIKFDWEVN